MSGRPNGDPRKSREPVNAPRSPRADRRGLERLRFLLCRGQAQRRVVAVSRDCQQGSEQWRDLGQISKVPSEQVFKLDDPLYRIVLRAKAGGVVQLGSDRMERAGRAFRRALVSDELMLLFGGRKPLPQRFGNPRLADARLARYQHDATFATIRLLPAAHQEINLLVAADQRRPRCTQRLEAAVDS